jgi:ATP-dependent protease HslVU (ClpYQ) peptidase subunit
MTCIVGMVDKTSKNVVIGGDSAASNSNNVFIRKDTKVFKNGDFIIGCTTSFRMMQLLRFSFKPPEIKCKDVYEYMCTDFIDEVRKCFRDGGYLQKYTDGDEHGGDFLVGYKNRLFRIEDDFQVAENLNGIDACGCGGDFALGSMHSLLKQDITTRDKIIKSLEAAEFFALGVSRPFVLMNT